MEETKSSAGRYYRPELDVIRFVAFLLVFLHHTLPVSRDSRTAHILNRLAPAFYALCNACGFGLSLFFTLSAFLICELLLRERKSAGTVAVKQFYIRRILRIWPLYYLGLTIGLIFMFLPGGDRNELSKIGWFAIFMGAWDCALHGRLHNPVNPLWSISVEEQFYLFAPWAVKYLNRKSLYGFCALLILVANAWLYYLGRVQASSLRIWNDSFVQFECFAGGILLCLILRGRIPSIATWARLMLIAGCFISWMTASYGLNIYVPGAPDNPGSWPLIGGYALAVLGCVLLLIAFLGVDPKFLPGWAVYLGRISFGLYVYHEFALALMRHLPLDRLHMDRVPIYPMKLALFFGFGFVLPLGLTILMASLSYRYFETPFLRMKKRHTVIESQPILEDH